MQCPYCGQENPADTYQCPNCGMLIGTELPGHTRHLEPFAERSKIPRWGTARLGAERKLLLHVRGHSQPLVIDLDERLIIGRFDTETGNSPDISLDEFDAEENGVSRRHAAILVEDDAIKVMDLGSANATYMNGQKLIAYQSRILRDGDELRLGKLVFRVNFA